jgi:hypothetical protein
MRAGDAGCATAYYVAVDIATFKIAGFYTLAPHIALTALCTDE